MSDHHQLHHFLKIKTHVLKVHMNCEGCLQRVRKLLKKIEGVYKVDIDGEQQKITVIGSVDSNILIQKLGKCGKHAELWPSSAKGDDEGEADIRKNIDNQMQDATNAPYTFQYQHTLPIFEREFGNGLEFECYLDPASSVSSSFQYNPIATTAAQKAGAYTADGKLGNQLTSMDQGYQFGRFPDDDVDLRGYQFSRFPDFHYAN